MEITLRKEVVINKQICRICMIFLSVIAIGLGAFVRIPLPFTPVPITLQTFFVLLSAALLGRKLSIIAQGIYLFLGILGLPVFTEAAKGLVYLFSPTAGYLIGFILASILTTVLLKRLKQGYFSAMLVFCASSAVILLSGSLWLKISLGISITQALFMGFIPFIFGDLLKSQAASFVYLKLNKRVKEILY